MDKRTADLPDYKERNEKGKKSPAELIAEQWAKKEGNELLRYGLDNSGFDKDLGYIYSKVPSIIRKTPDYILFRFKEEDYKLVEVKGCKETLNLKKEDWEEYYRWNKCVEDNFWFFICQFLNPGGECYIVTYLNMLEIIESGKWKEGVLDSDTKYPKPCFEISIELLNFRKVYEF